MLNPAPNLLNKERLIFYWELYLDCSRETVWKTVSLNICPANWGLGSHCCCKIFGVAKAIWKFWQQWKLSTSV